MKTNKKLFILTLASFIFIFILTNLVPIKTEFSEDECIDTVSSDLAITLLDCPGAPNTYSRGLPFTISRTNKDGGDNFADTNLIVFDFSIEVGLSKLSKDDAREFVNNTDVALYPLGFLLNISFFTTLTLVVLSNIKKKNENIRD